MSMFLFYFKSKIIASKTLYMAALSWSDSWLNSRIIFFEKHERDIFKNSLYVYGKPNFSTIQAAKSMFIQFLGKVLQRTMSKFYWKGNSIGKLNNYAQCLNFCLKTVIDFGNKCLILGLFQHWNQD